MSSSSSSSSPSWAAILKRPTLESPRREPASEPALDPIVASSSTTTTDALPGPSEISVVDLEHVDDDTSDAEHKTKNQIGDADTDRIVEDPPLPHDAAIDIPEPTPNDTITDTAAAEPKITAKLWISLLTIPVLSAGLTLINKRALQKGMDFHVLCLYRNVVASTVIAAIVYRRERNSWKLVTRRIVWRLLLLGLLEPMIDQQFLYAGLANMPASFSASIGLLQPVFTLVLSCAFRTERISIRVWPGQAKLLGALVAIIGAFLIIFAPLDQRVPLPWTSSSNDVGSPKDNVVTGLIFCLIAMFSSSGYSLLLENTASLFKCPWSITACTCLLGAIGNAPLVPILGTTNRAQYHLGLDFSLLAYLYSGIGVSVVSSFLNARVLKSFGTVRVGAVTPLSMVLVTIMSTALGEPLQWIRVIGVSVLLLGMGLILRGKHLEAT